MSEGPVTSDPATPEGLWRVSAEAQDLDRRIVTALSLTAPHNASPSTNTLSTNTLSTNTPPATTLPANTLQATTLPATTAPGGVMVNRLLPLFRAQVQSRHLDFAARWLQSLGEGFYTIGSAGHEANAAIGLLSEVTDPALLHYRSGGFYAARAHRAGVADPRRDVLLGVVAAIDDPISGGRHKVFGHERLHIIPQTSTIASHLPRAVGLAFALGLASRVGRSTPWPQDTVVICSFGDASANHSTAAGAMNAAAYLAHRGIECPILFVCEDNGLGISTPSPAEWTTATLRGLPGVDYRHGDGRQPLAMLSTVSAALGQVRRTRRPGVLHLDTVRYLGHAGSDVESAYRTSSEIQADRARDPILHTANAIIAHGLATPAAVADMYEESRREVMAAAESVIGAGRLASRAAVTRQLLLPEPTPVSPVPETLELSSELSSELSPKPTSATARSSTLAQAINAALAAVLEDEPGALVFGEDVARKGGVYGVTRGLQKRFGGQRIFDTILDEQTILGTALGTALAGFLPIPEIQYLAYLHNAEDQLRGEAASLAFFSNGAYRNGTVVRIAGLAYQKGFGGHFHNDNSLAVLRDIPGIVVAVPSSPADAAGMLRTCVDLAREHGRVCVFVEPIALYHTQDLQDGDRGWTTAVDPSARVRLGDVAIHGAGEDLLILTYGNGAYLSRRALARLSDLGIHARVMDIRWLLPLPVDAIEQAVNGSRRVLIVDETRASAGVADALATIVTRCAPTIEVDCVTSADSFIPLGPAAGEVLVQEDEIVRRACDLVSNQRRAQ